MANPNMNKMRRPRKGMPPKNTPKQPNNNWVFWIILGFILMVIFEITKSKTIILDEEKETTQNSIIEEINKAD